MIRPRLVVLAGALAAAACDQPPVKEVEAAAQQVSRAAQAGARDYAPERYQQAEDALALARRKIEERDYRGALSAANDAADRARAATGMVGPARAALRGSTEVALAEVGSALERAAAERAAAVKAGVPKPRLAELDARVATATAALADARTKLGGDDLLPLQRAADALRTDVAPLPDLYRTARTQHASRPRTPARPAPRRR